MMERFEWKGASRRELTSRAWHRYLKKKIESAIERFELL